MVDHMRELYQKLMREPLYRARAMKAREKRLEHRVFSVVTCALLVGLFGPGSLFELYYPETFWYGIAAAVASLYSLGLFLLDWPVLAMDLRARDVRVDASSHA